MFENHYIMNAKLYRRWVTPVFYKTKFFWVMVMLFLSGAVGTAVFYSIDATDKWKSLSLLLMFSGIYRGVFFDWISADRQFKIIAARSGKKEWDCRIVIGNTIRMFMDGKLDNEVYFGQIKALTEAKSYFDLATEKDSLRLDKAGFTKGSPDEFREWVLATYPEIEYKTAEKQFDK